MASPGARRPRLRSIWRRRRVRRKRGRLPELAWRIRRATTTREVIATGVAELEGLIPEARCSVWLRDRSDRLIRSDSAVTDGFPPRVVFVSARRRKLSWDGATLGMPLISPGSGFMGVLCVEDVDGADEEAPALVEELGREMALALGAARVHERAVAEKERTEAILSRVADAVVVTDPDGRLQQFNASAIEMLELDPSAATPVSCGEALRLRAGERQLDCSDGCALLKLGAANNLGCELVRARPDGSQQPLLGSASVVADAEGNTIEIVHSFRDITKLKEADEAKTMFLATASHELKTPLTVIRGFSEMLLDDASDANGDRAAKEAIARRSVELNRIVDRILLSSRIEAGRVVVQPVDLEIRTSLQERVDAFASSTGREITLEIVGELPEVSVDPVSLGSVIDHLLDNAVKYSPAGGAVRVEAAREDDDHVRVTVSDEGVGMTREQAARCFEKFFQGESSDVRRFGGTGIGLFIVRSLVEAMGGDVTVESELGSGSTFSVRLKVAGQHDRSDRSGPPPPEGPEPSVIREFMRQMGIATGGMS